MTQDEVAPQNAEFEAYKKAFNLDEKRLGDGEECSRGCRHHVAQRCEKCGRYGAHGATVIAVPKIQM